MRADHGERDDEIAELVDYFAGELPPERAAVVRRKLEEDPELAERVRPLVAAWTLEVRQGSVSRSAARRGSETRGAWGEVRQQIRSVNAAAAVGTSTVSLPGEPTSTAPLLGTVDQRGPVAPVVERPPQIGTFWRRKLYRGVLLPFVVSFVGMVLWFYGNGLYQILGPGWVKGHIANSVHRTMHRPIVDVVTGHGYEQLVKLPDGSNAVLDLMTWLEYPEHFGVVSRNARLVGRGRITVAARGQFPFRLDVGPALLEGGEEYTVDNTDRAATVWVTRGDLAVWRRISAEDLRVTVVKPGHVVHVTRDYIQVDTALYPPPTF